MLKRNLQGAIFCALSPVLTKVNKNLPTRAGAYRHFDGLSGEPAASIGVAEAILPRMRAARAKRLAAASSSKSSEGACGGDSEKGKLAPLPDEPDSAAPFEIADVAEAFDSAHEEQVQLI